MRIIFIILIILFICYKYSQQEELELFGKYWLIDNKCEEYGDCIIDAICEAVGILPTTIYYVERE